MRNVLLMDTNIVSLMGKWRSPPGLRPWLLEIGPARLAICYPVITELLRGAHLVMPSNAEKAREITDWVQLVKAADFAVLDMNFEVADIYARMTSTPRLKQMWVSNGQSKRNRLGHDLMIAAVSIVHQAPILTANVADFLSIDRTFPLPGVYHPFESAWYVAPPFELTLAKLDASAPDPHDHPLLPRM